MTSAGHTRARQYTLEDGLAGMLVEDIYQDRRGLLWIATADGGVSRFDGESFENFGLSEGLPHLTVMTIAEDANGRLWFGTLGGGLAVFDGRGFEVYTTGHGLPSDEILGLQPQDDGSMQVLTGAGIGRFAGSRCVECTTEIGGRPIGRVHDMVTDSTGTAWLATRERGIISLDGRSMSPVFAEGGTHNWAWKFARDAAGYLWIASRQTNRDAAVGRYDPQGQRLDLIGVDAPSEVTDILISGIRNIRLDDRDRLWMTRLGVLVYDGKDWHPFSPRLPDIHWGNTRLTYEDRFGNIWVGLYGNGLVLCEPANMERYTEADGLPDRRVHCLAEDPRGRILIGTGKGVACFEGDRMYPIGPDTEVFALEVDRRGAPWVGSWEGKVFKGEDTDLREIAALARNGSDKVEELCADQAGRMWVCTAQGLFGFIDEDRFTLLGERAFHRYATMIQDSEGVLWIGIQGKTPALYFMDGAHRFHGSDFPGLEAVYNVKALCEQQGTLWVGTFSGLYAIDLRSRKVRRFTTEQGLSANGIKSLGTDRQGRLWIGTSGGGASSYQGESFHSLRLGESAPENQVDAILCDRRGRVWFGTEGGLIMYRPRDTPPGIVIRQPVGGRLLEALPAASFREGSAEIAVHFQGIRFRIDEEPMRYSHRLVGYGPAEEWSEYLPANKVAYRDLPAGDYRFEVRTQDPEGCVSETAHLQVRVTPDPERGTARSPEPEPHPPIEALPGHGPTITRILSQLRKVAKTDMTVLLQGETGTGKGLIAREIHDLSPRRNYDFVNVNCGSLPSGLMESELFGHERGAFTGAVKRKVGYMEKAHMGTLFLDEIGELPPSGQQALLHILEDGLLRRVGGTDPIPVDLRVIAATNRDLEGMVREGIFRDDLYFRLKVFPVTLPPLRHRREEIPILAACFVAACAYQLQRPVPALSAETLGYLRDHPWPGNVRELEHLIRRAVVLCERNVIEVADLALPDEDEEAGLSVSQPEPDSSVELSEKKGPEYNEKQQIMDALKVTKGRIYGEFGAAQLLGMNPERLRSRMRAYGLRGGKKRP